MKKAELDHTPEIPEPQNTRLRAKLGLVLSVLQLILGILLLATEVSDKWKKVLLNLW